MSGTEPVRFRRGTVRTATRWGAIACLAAAGVLAYVLTPDPSEGVPEVAEARPRRASPASVRGYSPYRDVMGRDERNLFAFGAAFKARGAQAYSPDTAPKPEKPPDAEPTTPTAPAPQAIDTSGMNLLASWPGDDGKGTAWVSDSGKTVTVSVGETLRGAQVARIEPGAVVLKSGEQESRIESRSSIRALVMRPFKTGSAGPTVRVRTPTSPSGPPKPVRRSLGISVRDLSAREATEARAPANARSAVSEVARTDVDVRAGDFILAVDGQEVNSTAQALRLILAAQKQESVRLRLWREGREVEATVRWKE